MLELKKITEISGREWYAIYYKGRCEESVIGGLDVAEKRFEEYKINLAMGLPKEEIIRQETIGGETEKK
jgi:hypothetical protein